MEKPKKKSNFTGTEIQSTEQYRADIDRDLANLFLYNQELNTSRYLYFVVAESNLTASTNKVGRLYIDFPCVIGEAHASVILAGATSAIIVDLNKNDTTIWSTQGNRVSITSGATVGTQTAFDTTKAVAGDYFTLDVDQVGSTTAGSKLVVRLKLNV